MPKIALYPPSATLETAQAVTIPTCPGCGQGHFMPIRSEKSPVWHFNGDMDRPTLKPSILATAEPTPYRCHFFLTDGRAQFLTDSNHDQKGKTVELPELDAPAAGA